MQELEPARFQLNQASTQSRSEVRSATTVPGIGALVDPPAVVEDREQLNQFDIGAGFLRDTLAVLEHASPVVNTMNVARVECIVGKNGLEEVLSHCSDFRGLRMYFAQRS